jgi:hypothetical protein
VPRLETLMIRTKFRLLLVTLVTALALTTIAEAAPKKQVRHRAKHSSRVSTTGATATTGSTRTHAKSTHRTTKKRTTARKKKTTTAASARQHAAPKTTKPR